VIILVTNDNIVTNFKTTESKNSITFINMPISSDAEDKIGISQYADELKNVIKKGAQTIAVTSDFGGGKSSLIRCLETRYNSLFTKFCYINLWSHITCSGENNKGSSQNLHKAFIYQLASQIGRRKGNYVSRRLSQNYGMFGITLPSFLSAVLSFIMFFCFALGFVCTTLYEAISEYIDIGFYNQYHKEIGVVSFVLGGFLALFLLYKTDIVFSSKNSESTRNIDEHELMDIYKTHICNFHLKHYIVVVEDLDRSKKEDVNRFIKELRRYYIPYKKKRSKCRLINWINDVFINNVNRITFIVNIKSEKEIANSDDEHLYGKAFDYVLNLKEINIDNLDIILNKLLDEHRIAFKEKQIDAFKNNGEFIPEFEWIIRGKKIGLREIKNRLSSAILTYESLCSKFNHIDISIKKCIASAYLMSEFEAEYLKIKNIGFDKVIDLYVTNPDMTKEDIIAVFKDKEKDVVISEDFANDIKTLISTGLIASDYKQYFFNFPSDSYLYSDKENFMINTILYDQDISSDENFALIANEVIDKARDTVIKSFERLHKLGKYFPDCIFYCKELFDLAFCYNEKLMFKTLSEKLKYDEESISDTSKIIVGVIESNLINDQEKVKLICDIIVGSAPAKSIIVLRRSIIEKFSEEITKFRTLFIEDCPLITKIEIDGLKNNVDLLDLINIKSSEFTIELMSSIQLSILSGFDLKNENVLNRVAEFYKKVFEVFGSTEKETLTKLAFEIIIKSTILNETLESVIIDNNEIEDIIHQYTKIICFTIEHGRISKNTLQLIDELGICENLNEAVCIRLNEAGFYKSFIINASQTNINIIDFENEDIVRTVNEIDYNDEEDTKVSLELLYKIRKEILRKDIKCAVKQYGQMFILPNPVIEPLELQLISDIKDALELIDKEQLTEKNYAKYASYFSKIQLEPDDSFAVLMYVSDIDDASVKRELFLSLDLNAVQYYCLSAKRRSFILNKMRNVFDFEDVSEQITFMTHTMCSCPDFEKNIKEHISKGMLNEGQEKEYSNYVRQAKRINNGTINNLCSLKHIYAMPSNVLNKLFAQKKYTYYVASRTLEEGRFVFEQERIDELESAYQTILLSEESAYKQTKEKMSKNFNFITYMASKKYYVGALPYTRKFFAFCHQTIDMLQDLFANYDEQFIIEYLRLSKGFVGREEAVYFIEQIKKCPAVAADKGVYENNHHRLVDGPLKTSFTMTHKNAKEK